MAIRRLRLHRLGQRRTANDIEQSCGVLDVLEENGNVIWRAVIDCGLHSKPGAKRGEKGWIAPDFSLFEDGILINAVLFTHGHLDHVGSGPALIPYLHPDAKFWMTKPTAATIMYGYKDGLKIADNRESPAAFTVEQMYEFESRIEIIHRPAAGDFAPGIRLLVHPAGHINGACSFTFQIKGRRIHFAGDRCEHDQPGIKGAPPLPPDWNPHIIAGADCTYGADHDSDGRNREEEMARCFDTVAETLRKGSIALVHGFGIHRGGSVAHELRRRGLNNGSVVLDGACRYYANEQQKLSGRWSALDWPLDLRGVMHIEGRNDREWISRRKRTAIVTTSGMGGPGGPSTTWRREVLMDPNASMIFTGYVAPDTDGAKVLLAAAERERTKRPVTVTFAVEDLDSGVIHSETYALKCKVEQFRIGSHDSRETTLNWFRRLRPELAILTHGSSEALASLHTDLVSDIPNVIRSDEQGMVEIDI